MIFSNDDVPDGHRKNVNDALTDQWQVVSKSHPIPSLSFKNLWLLVHPGQ